MFRKKYSYALTPKNAQRRNLHVIQGLLRCAHVSGILEFTEQVTTNECGVCVASSVAGNTQRLRY